MSKKVKDADGCELEEKNSRYGLTPPQMTSFGSSSRLIYECSKDIPNFSFEKLLPTRVGHTANLDGCIATKESDIFVEAKCREIYSLMLIKGFHIRISVGYGYDGSIHFANAYFPVIFHDRVEIWKGDNFAGSVGIDPTSGLLKINAGGDFGPMEWFQERTESVFNSMSIDSIKETMGRYCLDEGIGIFDKDRTSNLQTANNDVARSKDSRLVEIVNTQSTRIPTGVKR